MPFRSRVFLASLPVLFVLSSARAQSTSALLNEALDKQVVLQLNSILPDALRTIAQKTGVRIEADPSVYELLPWGDQTNITANIQNMTLREALTALGKKLGLRFELGDNAVRLEPIPALTRLGRRSTVQELQLLDVLSSNPIRLPDGRPTLRQVIDSVDAALVAQKANIPASGAASAPAPDFVVENRVSAEPAGGGVASPLETIIPVSRNATLADALEAVSRSTSMTWYPWGRSVVVLPKEDQIRSLLQRPITVRYAGVDVGQVLLELSKLARVPFSIEPGAVQRIPPEFRSVRLIVDNATVQQVLEQLSGVTGLGWVVTDKSGGSVYIWNNSPIPPTPGAVAGAAGASSGTGRVSLLIPLGDGNQMVIPEAELPDDIREYLKTRRQLEISKLRDRARIAPPNSAVPPSTRPSTDPDPTN